jgi:hypothetical protein
MAVLLAVNELRGDVGVGSDQLAEEKAEKEAAEQERDGIDIPGEGSHEAAVMAATAARISRTVNAASAAALEQYERGMVDIAPPQNQPAAPSTAATTANTTAAAQVVLPAMPATRAWDGGRVLSNARAKAVDAAPSDAMQPAAPGSACQGDAQGEDTEMIFTRSFEHVFLDGDDDDDLVFVKRASILECQANWNVMFTATCRACIRFPVRPLVDGPTTARRDPAVKERPEGPCR